MRLSWHTSILAGDFLFCKTHFHELQECFITFNSTYDNPDIGDERNFIGIRERGTRNLWSSNFEVFPGKEYVIRLYIHNNASADSGLIAENVRAMINLPNTTGKVIDVNSFIESSNSTPNLIWDGIRIYSDRIFNVAYVKGSARFCNNHWGSDGICIPDTILTIQGARLGYDELNGLIPSGVGYAGYLTIVVRPQFAE